MADLHIASHYLDEPHEVLKFWGNVIYGKRCLCHFEFLWSSGWTQAHRCGGKPKAGHIWGSWHRTNRPCQTHTVSTFHWHTGMRPLWRESRLLGGWILQLPGWLTEREIRNARLLISPSWQTKGTSFKYAPWQAVLLSQCHEGLGKPFSGSVGTAFAVPGIPKICGSVFKDSIGHWRKTHSDIAAMIVAGSCVFYLFIYFSCTETGAGFLVS